MDSLNSRMRQGFSTIELMIAMAILVLVLTAVVLVSFSNQSFSIGSQTGNEAMKLAQEMLEEQQSLARKDFNLVNSTPSPIVDDIYKKEIISNFFYPNHPDPDYNHSDLNFLAKEVKAVVRWTNERHVDKTLELTTLITNFNFPSGANTCNSNLGVTDDAGNMILEDWQNPVIENTGDTDFASLVGDPAGTYPITDIDAYKERLYVTVGQTGANSSDTLYIFDISSPDLPVLLDSIDNASTVASGLNAVRVAEDPASGAAEVYIYAASNTASDYGTCNPVADKACGQIYIFKLNTSTDAVSFVANLKLNTIPSITGQNRAQSIFLKNGYVFLGLENNAGGPEFNAIDVHNPENISSGVYPVTGSFEAAVGINAINVRNSYAYLGVANSASEPQELRILNISNLSSPYPGPQGGPEYGFNASSGAGHGKSIQIVGDRLYLGKTTGAGEDFHIIDNADPAGALDDLGGVEIGSSVNGVVVRDYLSFLSTNNDLRILKTDDENNVSSVGSLSLPGSGSATYEPSMDCEGDRIYISANSALNKGSIYVIKSQ